MTTAGRISTFSHGGLTFEVLDRGPQDGPVAVLLHGFPQDATAYDVVARRLAEAGVRTLAPHQRGYSGAARPTRVSAYRMDHLVGDVTALLDAGNVGRAHLVGHDWGAAVAWTVAERHPERVASLTALSVPHPAALAWALRHDPDQLRRSWYILTFQVPWVPQRLLARMLRRGGLRRLGVPAEHAPRYAGRLGTAGAARGAINWYRAAVRSELARARWHQLEDGARVGVPTTLVWGTRDPYLGRTGVERTARHVEGDYRLVEVDAGHWLPEKHADVVVREVLARMEGAA